MLIDSGEIGKGNEVATYIKSEGIKSLDYVVATHPPQRPYWGDVRYS